MSKPIGVLISGLCEILGRSRNDEDKATILGAIEALAGTLDKSVGSAIAEKKRAPRRPTIMVDSASEATAPVKRKRRKISPQRSAELKLHGQLLGLLRQLSPRERENIAKIRKVKGLPEALRTAQALRAKSR